MLGRRDHKIIILCLHERVAWSKQDMSPELLNFIDKQFDRNTDNRTITKQHNYNQEELSCGQQLLLNISRCLTLTHAEEQRIAIASGQP